MTPEEMMKALREPFDAKAIKWRPGSTNKENTRGLALAYIDARDVMGRLDAVCGLGGWQDEYVEVLGRIVCRIGVKVGDSWVWKSDGAGDTQIEADKGGLSDAFKRAGVKHGVGRYLYYLPAVWCELDQYRKIKEPPQLPVWALPKREKP